MDLSMLSNEDYELYRKAEEEVSNEHPYRCVCGRMTTGLHERNCSAFRRAVERRFRKLSKTIVKTNCPTKALDIVGIKKEE